MATRVKIKGEANRTPLTKTQPAYLRMLSQSGSNVVFSPINSSKHISKQVHHEVPNPNRFLVTLALGHSPSSPPRRRRRRPRS
eukprot:scaffold27334_cov78-Skeletonema_dohrnii-CCMP3373.AAC.2